MAEFCRRHELAYSTMAAWCRKARHPAGLRFVEVYAASDGPGTGSNGAGVRFDNVAGANAGDRAWDGASAHGRTAELGHAGPRRTSPPWQDEDGLRVELILPGGGVLRIYDGTGHRQVTQEEGAGAAGGGR
jgi:hypothetical protein